MLRIYAQFMVAFVLLVLTAGGLSLAEEVGSPEGLNMGLQGSAGLEVVFTPIYPIESRLTLSLSVADFTFTSVTVFDMIGFLEQEIGVAVNLFRGDFTFASATVFDMVRFLEQEFNIAFFFNGVPLYTTTTFDYIGITKVSFGFEIYFRPDQPQVGVDQQAEHRPVALAGRIAGGSAKQERIRRCISKGLHLTHISVGGASMLIGW